MAGVGPFDSDLDGDSTATRDDDSPFAYDHAEEEAAKICPANAYDNTLEDVAGRLSFFLAGEESQYGRASSTLLMYFAGVLGLIDGGASFQSPSNSTPKLSALNYCSGLVLLGATLP